MVFRPSYCSSVSELHHQQRQQFSSVRFSLDLLYNFFVKNERQSHKRKVKKGKILKKICVTQILHINMDNFLHNYLLCLIPNYVSRETSTIEIYTFR